MKKIFNFQYLKVNFYKYGKRTIVLKDTSEIDMDKKITKAQLDNINVPKEIERVNQKRSKRIEKEYRKFDKNMEKINKRFEFIREKYERPIEKKHLNEIYYINKNDKNEENSKAILFAPLTSIEESFIKDIYDKNTVLLLAKGGRETLLNELTEIEKNKEVSDHPLFNIVKNDLSNFKPLSLKDYEFYKTNFPYLIQSQNGKNVILQGGQSYLESFKNLLLENSKAKLNYKESINRLRNDFTFKSLDVKSEPNHVKYSKLVKSILVQLNIKDDEIIESITSNDKFEEKVRKGLHLPNDKKVKMFNVNSTEKVAEIKKSIKNEVDFELYNISVIKGLSSNKSNNLSSEYYIYDDTLEPYGFRNFTMNEKRLDILKKTDEKTYQALPSIENSNFKITLRATVKFNKKGVEEAHFAVFDNELILPFNSMIFSSIDYPDLFSYYEYDKDSWGLLDIDNSQDENLGLVQPYSDRLIDNLFDSFLINQYIDSNIINVLAEYYNSLEKETKEKMGLPTQKVDEIKEKEKPNKKQPEKKKIEGLINSYKITNSNIINKESLLDLSNKNPYFGQEKETLMEKYIETHNKAQRTILSMKLACFNNKNTTEIERDLLTIEQKIKEFSKSKLDEVKKEEILNYIRNKFKEISPFSIVGMNLLSSNMNKLEINKENLIKERKEREKKAENYYKEQEKFSTIDTIYEITENYIDAYKKLNFNNKSPILSKEDVLNFFQKRQLNYENTYKLPENKLFVELSEMKEELQYMDYIDNIEIQDKRKHKRSKVPGRSISKYYAPEIPEY